MPTLTRRELGAVVAGAIAAAPQLRSQAGTSNPGPALDIAEWSYHWYGVEHVDAGPRHGLQRDADVRGALDSGARSAILIPSC